MNQFLLIAKREFLNKIRNKSFIIMTFLSPLIVVAAIGLITYLTQLNNDKVKTISVLDKSHLFVDEFKDTKMLKYDVLGNIDLKQAKTTVKANKNYGLLYIPQVDHIDWLNNQIKFYSDESPSIIVVEKIEHRIEQKIRNIKLKKINLEPHIINQLDVKVDTTLETFEGEQTSKLGNGLKLIFGGAAGYLLFMFIIIYGNMIMRSVIEEKTSRIIEIIISSVRPIKLLFGKIVGTSLAGILQFLIWIIIGVILLTLSSMIWGLDANQMTLINGQEEMMIKALGNTNIQHQVQLVTQEIMGLPLLNLTVMFVFYFIGGYLLYSSLYAAIGAAVDSETDTQQFMLPILMPLMLGIYIGFFTVIENPHGMVSQVFSYIPLTSPVVMLMRIPFGVPLWQQLVSLLILVISFLLTVRIAAKIYRIGILVYGKKPSYRELIKWLRY